MRARRRFSVGLSVIVIITQLMLPLGGASASQPALSEQAASDPRQPSLPSPLESEPVVIPVNDGDALARPPTPSTTSLPRPSATTAAQQVSAPLGTGNNNYGQTQRDTDNPQNHPGHHFAGSVNLVNGNFYLTAGDFFIPGRGLSLQLARSYNSLSAVPMTQTTTLVSETFDEGFPPLDWSVTDDAGTCPWESTASLGETNSTGGSGSAAVAHSTLCGAAMRTGLWTWSLDLSGLDAATLSFRTEFNTGGLAQGTVEVSTDGGSDWDILLTYFGDNVPGPHLQELDLSDYAGSASVIVRFYYNTFGADGWWQVDDVQITGTRATEYVGAFGAGWTHSYETHVISETGGLTLTVREADGSLHDYHTPQPCLDTPAYTCYESPPGLYRQLRDMAGSGYMLLHKNGTMQLFGADGRFVEITDPNDNQVNLYYYDATGVCPLGGLTGPADELCWVDDPSGRRSLQFYYNMGSGFVEMVQEWLNGVDGRSIVYSHDLDGNLTDVAYPEGAAHYDYDDQNRMVGYTDPRQPAGVRKTDEIVYDEQSRVITHFIDSFFDVFYELEYDQPPQMGLEQGAVSATIVTDGQGGQTLVEFDDHANVVYEGDWFPELELWVGKWWWWYPDYWWLLWQRVDALERVSEYAYDPWGNTTLAVNHLGAQQTFQWEPPYYESLGAPDPTYGNILTATNGSDVSTRYEHDYDPTDGDALWEIQAAGTTSESVTLYQNDVHGQLVLQVDNAGQSTKYGYDEFGNTTSITNAHGIVTYNEFDDVGRPHTTIDQADYSTRYEYDEADRLVKVTDAREGVTSYTYSEDGRDNLVELVNAGGVTTTYFYDGLDRLISQTNSLDYTTGYEYDSLNRLIVRTGADGRFTTYDYDAKDRMIEAAYYEAGALEPYQVNEYRYDPVGNLIWMGNENAEFSYTYDDLDQRVQIDMWTPTWGATRTLQLDHDPLSGDLTQLRGPGDYQVDYEYGPLNRLVRVTELESGSVDYQYDLGGRKTQTLYSDGTLASFKYDLTNHLTDLTYQLADGETIEYTYAYDERGNVFYETDEGEIVQYEYDEVGQVISMTNELQGQVQYSYDPVGNRLTAQNAMSETEFVYNEVGQLVEAGGDTYIVNEMGARVQAELSGLQEPALASALSGSRGATGTDAVTLYYRYDNDMRVLQVQPGLTFLYDPLGNVIGTLDDEGNYRYFLRDGEDIYLELDGNGDVLAQYVIGAEGVVSMWQDGGRYLILYDGRGLARRVLDLYSGQVVVRYSSDLNDLGSGPYYLYNPIRIRGAWWFPYVGLALFGDGVFWDYRSGVFLVKAWPWLYWPFGPFHPWRPIFRFWPWPWPWARPWGWPWPRPWPFLWPWPGAWVRPWVIWPFWPWGLRPWWPWWYWRAWWGWRWWGHWWCWHPWWWSVKWWWWPWWHPWWWWGYWWFPWWWWWPCWWWPGYWWWWNWWWWPWWWGGWNWWCWWWWWPWWWPGWFWWWPWYWPPAYAHGPPDVGDAPDPLYPSYRRNWGAVHGNWWYEWLGTWRDGEWDSEQVDADAYDDGVTLDLGLGELTFTPTVANPAGWRYIPGWALHVHGWADWNSDGDWDDSGEFITNWSGYPGDGLWPVGQNSFPVAQPFAVPGAAFGPDDVAELWLRFRLDYAHNLESTRGYTRFGEVEDHLFTLVHPHQPDWDGQLVGNLDASLVITYTRAVSDVLVSIAPGLHLTPTWSVVDSGSQLTLEHAPFAPGQRYTVSLSSGVTYTGTGLVMPDDFGFEVSAIAPDEARISGPTLGGIGQSYRFDADVGPLSTTLPLTYTWQATGQSDVTDIRVSALSHAVSYTWSTTGTQTVTLTARNAVDAVSATHQVYISTTVPPGDVSISGPDAGEPGQSYTFVAAVQPDSTTPPIVYTWQASGQSDVVTTTDALSHSVSYVWSTTGVQTITVMAQNALDAVSSTHYVNISLPPPTPPDDVSISGPDAGQTGQSYTFVAGVTPGSATLPLTYTWQATGQSEVMTSTNALGHSVSYTWNVSGLQTITVTASNAAGAVSDTHQISITAPSVVSPDSVHIVGPDTGMVNDTHYFTATALPGNVSLPLTFYWQATGQAPLTRVSASASDVVSYTWSTTGTQTITVTVSNAGGSVGDTRDIEVALYRVYLPLAVRRQPSVRFLDKVE